MQKLFDGNMEAMGYVDEHDCPHCKYGWTEAPPFHTSLTLAEQRVFQAAAGMIVFCTCERGEQYRTHLRQVYADMMQSGYYKKYVIDTMTKMPMISEDGIIGKNGKPVSWFEVTQERVLEESTEAAAAHFRAMNE